MRYEINNLNDLKKYIAECDEDDRISLTIRDPKNKSIIYKVCFRVKRDGLYPHVTIKSNE